MGLFDRFKKHQDEPAEGPQFLYTKEEIEAYETFIQSRFGPFDQVLHEIVSPDIHLDVIMVPPTKERRFYKLITMGMGAYRMQVPREFRNYELERAELIIYLLPDWKIGSDAERDYWPIRWLKTLARYPLTAKTWLAAGHTVSANEYDEPVADNTGFTGFLLVNGTGMDYQTLDFRLPGGEKVNFYEIIPLYPEEVRLKLEHGMDALMDRFTDEDLFPLVNIKRKNHGKEG